MTNNLISVEQLAATIDQHNVVIVDCRFSLTNKVLGENVYNESHIPGAYYLHLERDLSSPMTEHGGRHPLPDTFVLAEKLTAIGVCSESLVIAYDDSRMAFASRLWWLLRYLGHSNVKVLDGGFQAWCDAGQQITDDIPGAKQNGKLNIELQPQMLASVTDVRSIQSSGSAVLIDSREEQRYLGTVEPIDPVAGHIEGAVNYPWTEVTNKAGFICDRESLQKHWKQHLNTKELVVYCGSGVTACVNLISLSESGRDDARLYAGSWSDWISYL